MLPQSLLLPKPCRLLPTRHIPPGWLEGQGLKQLAGSNELQYRRWQVGGVCEGRAGLNFNVRDRPEGSGLMRVPPPPPAFLTCLAGARVTVCD